MYFQHGLILCLIPKFLLYFISFTSNFFTAIANIIKKIDQIKKKVGDYFEVYPSKTGFYSFSLMLNLWGRGAA